MPNRPARTLTPLLALLTLAASVTVQAQTTADPDAPARIEDLVVVEHDGWQMELPADQPLVLYVRETSTNLDGAWVLYTPFARDASGALTPLTPCDDLSVTCLPIRTRADRALTGATVGDTLILASDK